jgi:hypothetical protein
MSIIKAVVIKIMTILTLYFSKVSSIILFRSNLRKYSRPQVTRLFGQLKNSDAYRSVDIICNKCNEKLFKYKKKNGTNSSLIKIYYERIVRDPHRFLKSTDEEHRLRRVSENTDIDNDLICPKCQSKWGRRDLLTGHLIYRCIGGKLKIR